MNKIEARKRRARKTRLRIRENIKSKEHGSPRLVVTRSNANISVQLIVDQNNGSKVIAFASSAEKDVASAKMSKTEKANKVGQILARRASDAGVVKVAFDRSGYKYHGRVKALAEGARDGGMDF